MKSNYLIRALLAGIIAFLPVFSATAQSGYGVALEESFEGGTIPANWTVYNVDGDQDWVVTDESGSVATSAAQGDYWVALMHPGSVQLGYITQLQSPVLKLDTLNDAVLMFSYMLTEWSGDTDSLRVLYRNNAPDAEWTQLRVYTDATNTWQEVMISLGRPGAQYQIAFEGIDMLGGGIAIDNVLIQSDPTCDVPSGFSLDAVANDSAWIQWTDNWNALEYAVKVSKTPLSADELESEDKEVIESLVADTTVAGWPNRGIVLRDLDRASEFYMYVNTSCVNGSMSGWSEAYKFSTLDMMELSWKEDFNDYTGSTNMVPENYVTATSSGISDVPFVNTGLKLYGKSYMARYSPDTTQCLVFTSYNTYMFGGSSFYQKPIPANEWAYIALPEMDRSVKMNEIQVSFYAGWKDMGGEVSKILVGVMADVNDKASFEAIDTVVVPNTRELFEYIISFEHYEGDKRYIALMSDFDQTNTITIDNLEVKKIPDPAKPRDLKIGYPSSTEVTVEWSGDAVHGATGYEIVVSAEKLTEAELAGKIAVDGTKILAHESGSTLPLTASDNIDPWMEGYVYARNTGAKGAGEWSLANKICTPGNISTYSASLPYTYEFTTTGDNVYYPYEENNNMYMLTGLKVHSSTETAAAMPRAGNVYGLASSLPLNSSSNALLVLTVDDLIGGGADYGYVVFPEVANLNECVISFYATGGNMDIAGVNDTGGAEDSTNFVVGYMTDANDISTFVPVDTIETKSGRTFWRDYGAGTTHGNKDWGRYWVYFDNVPDNAKFFAFKAAYDRASYAYTTAASPMTKNENHIDNVTVAKIGSYRMPDPDKFEVDNSGSTSVKVSWPGEGNTGWEVKVWDANNYVDYQTIETSEVPLIENVTIDGSSFTVSGLEPNGHKYRYSVKPEGGEWLFPLEFETGCAGARALPYEEGFDNYPLETRPYFSPSCLSSNLVYHIETDYEHYYLPYITVERSYNNSASSLKMGRGTYVAFPELENKNIAELSLRMFVRPDEADSILVGVMSNPDDLSTFRTIKGVYVRDAEVWSEVVADLSAYTASGNGATDRIAIYTPRDIEWFVDSVVIDLSDPCPKVSYPTLVSVTDNSATVTWTRGGDESAWQVLMTDSLLTSEDEWSELMNNGTIENVNAFPNANVTTDTFTVTGLKDNTEYYFYVRSKCGEGTYGKWANDYGTCRTMCVPTVTGEDGIQTFDDIYCWTVGNLNNDGTAAPSLTSGGHEGKGLKFDNAASGAGLYAISPMFEIEEGKDITAIEVRFWGKGATGTKLRVGVRTATADPDTWREIYVVEGTGSWTEYTVSFDRYTGDNNGDMGRLVEFRSTGFDFDNNFIIDDVAFHYISDCPSAVGLTVEEVGGTEATISWTRGAAPFTIWVSTSALDEETLNGEKPEGVLEFTSKEDMSIELTGLEANTSYYAYILASCPKGNDKSEWSSAAMFTTTCPEYVKVPFADAINSYEEGSLPECWYGYAVARMAYLENPPAVASAWDADNYSQPTMGGRSILVFADNATQGYLALPRFAREDGVTDLKGLTLAFDATGTYFMDATGEPRSVIVGICTDNTSKESVTGMTPIDTVTVYGTTHRCFINFDDYDYNGEYIVLTTSYELNLRMVGGASYLGGFFLSNIEVYETPSCPKPEEFALTGVTDNSIALKFREIASATEWNVKYVEVGTEDTVMAKVNQTDTLKNLVQATTYEIYVQSVCSEEDQSTWAGPLTATTLSTPLTMDELPYDFGFENTDDNKLWLPLTTEGAAGWVIGTGAAEEGTNGLYISTDGEELGYDAGKEAYAWIYRTIEFTEGTYVFEYDWRAVGETNEDYIRVGLIPDSYTPEAGTANIGRDELGCTKEETPSYWIPLEGVDEDNAQRYQLNGSSEWAHNEVEYYMSAREAGLYKLVVFWRNNEKDGDNAALGAAIDNVVIKEKACVPPTVLTAKEVYDSLITVEWNDLTGMTTGWEVYYTTEMETATPPAVTYTKVQKEQGPTYTIEKLAPDTEYRIFVRSLCSAEDGSYSSWSEPIDVRTAKCTAMKPNGERQEDSDGTVVDQTGMFVWSFNMNDGQTELETNVVLPSECFSVGGEAYNASGVQGDIWFSAPYIKYNTSNTIYSLDDGGDGVLILNYDDAGQAGNYVAFPLMEADFDTMQVSFWMRAGYRGPLGWSNYADSGRGYAHAVEVGTMSNPGEPSTFELLETVVYPETSMTSSNSNDYWIQYFVSLAGAEGRYLVLKNPEDASLNRVFIDEVVVGPAVACFAPKDLRADVSYESIKVSFDHSEGTLWEVMVTDAGGMDTIIEPTEITTAEDALVEGLEPNTSYRVFVRQVCDREAEDGKSEWSEPVTITTKVGVRFTEEFSEEAAPTNWIENNYLRWRPVSGDALAGFGAIGCAVGDETIAEIIHRVTNTGNDIWSYEDCGYGLEGMHATVELADTLNAWIATPVIDLREFGEGDSLQLTFDLALTQRDNGNAISDLQKGMTDKAFAVAISADEGKRYTYCEENAIIWGNGIPQIINMPADYSLDEISNTGEQVRIDLSKYAGKQIKIAFFAQSSDPSAQASYKLHLDNVQVNQFINSEQRGQICEGETFVGENGFTLPSSAFTPGEENNLYIIRRATTEVPDTNYSVKVTVNARLTQIEDVTICEGESTTIDGIPAYKAGLFKKKGLTSTTNGCDSIFAIQVTVLPNVESAFTDSMCSGVPYEWTEADTVINEGGVFTHVFESSNRCDSTVTLTLIEMRSVTVDWGDTTVCYGGSVVINGVEYREAGPNTVRLSTDNGCDSVINFNLIVLPEFRSQVDTAICKGSTYSDKIFGELTESMYTTVTAKSSHGCDSTVTLHLAVIDDGFAEDWTIEIEKSDLPYTVFGHEFPATLPEGTYTEVITVSADGCEGTINLTLKVGKESGNNTTYTIGDMILAPNPVKAGESVEVHLDLTDEEREGLTVRVYNNVGALIQSFRPEGDPITIDGLNVSGVYLVRVDDGKGRIYQGKIIVK